MKIRHRMAMGGIVHYEAGRSEFSSSGPALAPAWGDICSLLHTLSRTRSFPGCPGCHAVRGLPLPYSLPGRARFTLVVYAGACPGYKRGRNPDRGRGGNQFVFPPQAAEWPWVGDGDRDSEVLEARRPRNEH